MENKLKLSLTAVVLCACLSTGFWIARHKVIWTDEFFTTASSVEKLSYWDQWRGRIAEGNNTPLYYSLQKFVGQVTHYQMPPAWATGQWHDDAASRIALRIVAVICISLSMALVFHYFLSTYSVWAGLYALFIYLSSYMLWVYWAEARPYALIVLLSTVQSLAFLKATRQKPPTEGAWKALAVTHILLAFTFIFSIGQVVAASFLLWLWGERDWKKYIFLTLIPVAIALFYYAQAPQYPFHFGLTPEQLIRDNVSRERFYIFFAFLAALAVHRFKPIGPQIAKPVQYLSFIGLVLLATAAVLLLFVARQCPPPQGFPITSRYFIYLTPIGVIAAVLCSVELIRSLSKYRWIQIAVIVGIALLVVPRFFKIVPRAIHSILGG